MADKIQELTNKLYQEGIEKAKKEAEQIVADAQKKASKIVEDAKKEQDNIIKKANEQAADLRKNVQSEVTLAGKQAVSDLRQQIVNMIERKMIETPVKDAVSDSEFLKTIITTMIKNWKPQSDENIDVAVLLPADKEKEFVKYFQDKAHALLNQSVEIKTDNDLAAGFILGPQDGSYKLKFSDKDFENFFKNYLRPHIYRLLYAEEN